MDSLAQKIIQVPRGYTYTYYTAPAKGSKSTILLLHGFPDRASLWANLITHHLMPNGYGVVAIDCLGYAGSSKPTDSKAYAFPAMTADVVSILDAEKIDKVVSFGHDWGSAFAQRMWLHHPERVSGLAMLNVAYQPPSGARFDLEQMRAQLEPIFGYFPFWYWHMFASPEGPGILNTHLESCFDVMHGSSDTMVSTMCTKDGLKSFVSADKKQNVESYVTPEMKRDFITRFERDGFDAPLAWYRATVDNTQSEAEKDLPKERLVVTVPSLFVGGKQDKVCLSAAILRPIQLGLLPHLTREELDAGHWCMLAKPEELGRIVIKWLESNFS